MLLRTDWCKPFHWGLLREDRIEGKRRILLETWNTSLLSTSLSHETIPITLSILFTELFPFFDLENSWLSFYVQVVSPKPLKVFTWNFAHVYGFIIVGHRPRPITLAWILTELLPFFDLEKSWLSFCVQAVSPQPLKVFTWNLAHVYGS